MRRFGHNLKNELEDAWMTQKELAEATRIAESTISYYSKGERMPRIDNIHRIAFAIGCSVLDLIGEAYEDIE